jgi:hypothetical protein
MTCFSHSEPIMGFPKRRHVGETNVFIVIIAESFRKELRREASIRFGACGKKRDESVWCLQRSEPLTLAFAAEAEIRNPSSHGNSQWHAESVVDLMDYAAGLHCCCDVR